MNKHTKNFIDNYHVALEEYIACAICSTTAIDLHHISKRSEWWTDEVWNILPLCRLCHMDCEARKYTPLEQQEYRKQWHDTYHEDKQWHE